MIESLHPKVPFSAKAEVLENGRPGLFSLANRFNFSANWEKIQLICNTALLLAGIAYGFFAELPYLMVGLTGYAIFYLKLQSYIENSRSVHTGQLEAQLRRASLDYGEILQNLTLNHESGVSSSTVGDELRGIEQQMSDIQQSITEKTAQFLGIREQHTRELRQIQAEIADAKRQRDALNV